MSDPLSLVVRLYPEAFRAFQAAEFSSLPVGWTPLVVRLLGDFKVLTFNAGHHEGIAVRRIKERFGTLWFYWSLDGQADIRLGGACDRRGKGRYISPQKVSRLYRSIRARVFTCERDSETFCEKCSRDAAYLTLGSCKTLCAECRVEHEILEEEPGNGLIPLHPPRVVEAIVRSCAPDQRRVEIEDAAGQSYEITRRVRLIKISMLSVGDRVVFVVIGRATVVSAVLVR